MLLAAGTAGLLIAMAMMIVRAIMGPSHYDRILAVNSFGTKTVLLLAVIGFVADQITRPPVQQIDSNNVRSRGPVSPWHRLGAWDLGR